MRWLLLLAILIAGGAAYLKWTMSDGATAPRDRTSQPTTDIEVVPAPAGSSAGTPQPKREVRPSPVPPKHEPASPTRPVERPTNPVITADVPGDAATEEVPWTDQQRQQQLWTAHGRYEKGNYPGAVEAALELARRYPDSLWEQDGWKVAIQAHCALSEPNKANALFAKMTDPTAIVDATKACTGWGVKLTK